MHSLQALCLGIIEGITEYLPISSTGHLIVAQRLMGIGVESGTPFQKEAAACFAICIQGGAIMAVLGLYFRHVLQMLRGFLGKDAAGLHLAWMIVVGFLPAAVLGSLLNHWIETKLFGIWPIVVAWILGGFGILAVISWKKRYGNPNGNKELVDMTWQMALIVGLLQCVAMCPGTSRSLMTIAGGLLVGLTVHAAVEYSFLLGVLTLTAATAKKALGKIDDLGANYHVFGGGLNLMWDVYGPQTLLVGIVAAAISAAFAVKWLVSYLQKHSLSIFGYYRIAIGLLVIALIAAHVVEA